MATSLFWQHKNHVVLPKTEWHCICILIFEYLHFNVVWKASKHVWRLLLTKLMMRLVILPLHLYYWRVVNCRCDVDVLLRIDFIFFSHHHNRQRRPIATVCVCACGCLCCKMPEIVYTDNLNNGSSFMKLAGIKNPLSRPLRRHAEIVLAHRKTDKKKYQHSTPESQIFWLFHASEQCKYLK